MDELYGHKCLCEVYDRLRIDKAWGVENQITTRKTRMVQLPATAAIEYVAACWVSNVGWDFCPGCFCPGGLLPGGLFPRGSIARGHFWPEGFLSGGDGVFCPGGLCPGDLCPFPPSSMRIRTV